MMMKKSSIKSKVAKNKAKMPKKMGSSMPMGGMAPSKGMKPMMGMKKGGMAKKPGVAIMIAIGKPKGKMK
jgi:hypothetical protein